MLRFLSMMDLIGRRRLGADGVGGGGESAIQSLVLLDAAKGTSCRRLRTDTM